LVMDLNIVPFFVKTSEGDKVPGEKVIWHN
jgi:hypothetical protein